MVTFKKTLKGKASFSSQVVWDCKISIMQLETVYADSHREKWVTEITALGTGLHPYLPSNGKP